MRDFISTNYCDILWINDLLSLKTKNSNQEYVAQVERSGKKQMIAIKFVAILGVIIEIKCIPNKGYLYTVDDGTGVIQCNHNSESEQLLEIVETIESESDQLNETIGRLTLSDNSRSINESTKSDDTIFNDKTFQNDELLIMKRNRLKGLQSLWTKSLESFRSLVNKFSISDNVYVEGKLYTYFDNNQIYVNSIRHMNDSEVLIHREIKLQECFDPLVSLKEDPDPDPEEVIKRNPKRKFSGIITFDHIPHTEINVPPPPRFLTPKKSDGEDSFISKKRNSIISPYLGGIMTFDTNYNNNDSMELDEL